MTSPSSYTPLESLLLFQALLADGVTSIPFNNISNQLLSIPLVRNDPLFDRARLEPAALKRLYLGLLKEEAQEHVDKGDATGQDGRDGVTNSRKRRAPTPSLPTVEEAAKNAYLIPKLIYRLYARYREKVVEEIRAEERNYDAATRDIKELEEAQRLRKLQEQVQEQEQEQRRIREREQQQQQQQKFKLEQEQESELKLKQEREREAELRKHHQEQEEEQRQEQERLKEAQKQVDLQLEAEETVTAAAAAAAAAASAASAGAATSSQVGPRKMPDGPPIVALSTHAPEAKEKEAQSTDRLSHTSIDAVISHEPASGHASPSPHPPPPTPRAQTTTALPPLSELAPESPRPYAAPPQPPSTSQLPPVMQTASGYRSSPPIVHQAHFSSQYPLASAPGPSASPQLQTTMARSSPSSPRPVLPLPPGMKLQSQSPIMHNGNSPHRPHSQLQSLPSHASHPPHRYASPTQRLPHVPLQPSDRNAPRAMLPHLPTPPAYPQPYPQFQGSPQPYPLPAYPQQPSAARPAHHGPPHQGGVQLPPFQLGPQEPTRQPPPSQNLVQHPPIIQTRPAPTPPLQQHPFPPYSPYGQSHRQLPLQQQHHHHAPLVNSIVEALRRTPWPTWKAARPSHLPHPQSDASPVVEPLSPVAEFPKLPPRAPSPPADENKDTTSNDHLAPNPHKSTPSSARAGKRERRSARTSRAGSAASSLVTDPARPPSPSRSVASRAGSQSAQPVSFTAIKQVKDEPTTPAESLYQDTLSRQAETPTANRGGRQRRSTTQAGAQSTTKRKRQPSPSPPADDAEAVPTYLGPRNDVVAASRNFQRLSAVIMNDISTHKHAGPFQKPVREKDAEGYGDIIKRPQDLKSIKAAITTGTRAITAATVAKDSSTDSPAATPSSNAAKEGGTIMLEKTADLIPPRAIVNSSQLEKEVMRMFANAVMFNPGEDGMVQDAREMADDIEAKVRDWRSAERQVEGRDEDDDSTAASAGPGKRRKL